jgi:hypothetical protein
MQEAEMRYLAPVIPLCIVIEVLLLRRLWSISIFIAGIVAAIIFTTTLLNLLLPQRQYHVFPMIARCTYLSFLDELWSPPPDPFTAAAQWIDKNVSPNQSICTYPGYTSFPLMFLQPKAVYAWLLPNNRPPPMAGLPSIDFAWIVPPDYFIVFGLDAGAVDSIRNLNRMALYEPAAILNVYGLDRFRPEIAWHTFSPITDFDAGTQAVYVYRRVAGN